VLEENEALRKDGLACTLTNVVLRHVTNKQEAENLLKYLYVLIIKVRDKLAKLLPCYTFPADINV
jgi:hypothetical protein